MIKFCSTTREIIGRYHLPFIYRFEILIMKIQDALQRQNQTGSDMTDIVRHTETDTYTVRQSQLHTDTLRYSQRPTDK